ncbi:MAG: cell wall-active antibiotics response protein [Chloroflexi bacterium]|nr:cell wall-active antibiotics response protein [Chloroflexota bacterium]
MLRRVWLELAAVFLVVMGVLLLLNTLGVLGISIGDVFGGAFAVLLVLLGLFLLRRSRRPLKEPFRDQFLGTMSVKEEGWGVGDHTFQMGFGEIKVDLTKTAAWEGEHSLHLAGIVGHIQCIVPREVPISAETHVLIGSSDVLGRKAEGFLRSVAYIAPGYATATRKLAVDASMVMGEISITAP